MTSPGLRGFRFAGIRAGIKKGEALDLGVVLVDGGAACAGVYTTNRVVAAPVVLSRAALGRHGTGGGGRCAAVIVNSGNANACTGAQGMADARETAERVAAAVGCDVDAVQVCSTGVIGKALPMDALRAGLSRAIEVATPEGLDAFAEAIMTTDTRPKTARMWFEHEGRTITVVGAAKGAGMIHPDMATMLGYVFTDAEVEPAALQAMWSEVCDRTFNAITVDGDTSTNDTALILAGGAAGAVPIEALAFAVERVAEALAVEIVRDAEGGTKTVQLTVKGAADADEARQVAHAIATSPLVKTAIHGEDPNWGRIIAAAGRSGASVEADHMTLSVGETVIYSRGRWQGEAAEAAAHETMKTPEYPIELHLGRGDAARTVWTSDLSAGYVRINADYRS